MVIRNLDNSQTAAQASEPPEALALYDRIESLACEIQRDEQAIKDRLISALEGGQKELALQILREWRTTPPRDVVIKYLEADHGNSE